MSKDRDIATDALEVLGLPDLGGKEVRRDAIHLAVEPGIAGEDLLAGDNIRLEQVDLGSGPGQGSVGRWFNCSARRRMAVVDPFLTERVPEGGRFLAVIPPRQITSLRHVWEAPGFGAEENSVWFQERYAAGAKETLGEQRNPVEESRKWIEDFATKIRQDYGSLMLAAEKWERSGGWTYDNSESYKDHWDEFPEFWKHYEIVKGEPVSEITDKDCFFTCSC